jgi:hypothetical protein
MLQLIMPTYVKAKSVDDSNWVIAPGLNVGPITGRTSEKELSKIFGKENVTPTTIQSVEYSYLGTSVYKGTENELQIIWKTQKRESPSEIIVDSKNTKWHTVSGITIGTTLDELIKLNGRDFEIHGFGWDYGGYIKSWEGGKLDKDHKIGKDILIELGTENQIDPLEINKAVGSSGFSSKNKIIRRMGLKVVKMILIFP